MRLREVLRPLVCVMLATAVGCDNVQWGGVDISLRAPDPPPSALVPIPTDDATDETPTLLPISTGPLLYLVERSGTSASLLPIAEIGEGGFAQLPDPDENPDFVERFPLDRWEAGTEFVLLTRGRRAGTFLSDGSARMAEEGCRIRPRGGGRVELRPEAQGATRFLAIRKADLGRSGLDQVPDLLPSGWPGAMSAADLRAAALSAARFTLERTEIPWPPSLPEILREQRAVTFADGSTGLLATYIFGGDAEVGSAPPTGYGLTVLARSSSTASWTPVWLWGQMVRAGKAFPRIVADGGLHTDRAPEILLEIFGEDRSWFALLGEGDDGWDIVYRDECGADPARGSARSWP